MKKNTGKCFCCGKELTGNIDFSREVQCWVCSERKALYYLRVGMARKAPARAVAGRTALPPCGGKGVGPHVGAQAVKTQVFEQGRGK
jgi:DNA-directed RNA polymerase subunit RPC12/RpoP